MTLRTLATAALIGLAACATAPSEADPAAARLVCTDDDLDGFCAEIDDCDDQDPSVFPGATEICNDIDDDCDGNVDVGAVDATTWYADADADGYGDALQSVIACSAPGYVTDDTDCDDTEPTVYPGGSETCDGLDNDCNGIVDDAVLTAPVWYADADDDGFGDPDVTAMACDAPFGFVVDGSDCDDADALAYPGATELIGDQVDEDCDGGERCYVDADDDGWRPDETTTVPSVDADCIDAGEATWLQPPGDCDDGAAAINPDATEVCDAANVDEDCDGAADDLDTAATGKTTFHPDADADGYGDAGASALRCDAGPGDVLDGTDCDDAAHLVNPGATEVCNDVDDDCDGTIDGPDATDAPLWYADADADGYGAPTGASRACTAPTGSVAHDGDCDDTDPAWHPGAAETCSDPNDYNCDGAVGFVDADTDGVAACDDCDDGDAAVFPGAPERCDGVDDDCDGTVDEPDAIDATPWYADADADGYGGNAPPTLACTAPPGTVASTGDCNDADPAFHPDATEVCTDPADYNCDGSSGFADADLDGVPACEDCDDDDATAFPGADETCDGKDDDCDGTVDEPDAIDAVAWYADLDDDGYGDDASSTLACTAPPGTTDRGGDCDDTSPAWHPGAPETSCTDPNDYNCDGSSGFADADDDGTPACQDCNDANPAAEPGNVELCNGFDDDCDGTVDVGADDQLTWHPDADRDRYGSSDASLTACTAPTGWIEDDQDCDDDDADVHPGARETCTDLVDLDCDGTPGGADADADGSADCLDCDDGDPDVRPGTPEVCDGVDQDCDGATDEQATDATTWYLDADDDGAVDPLVSVVACTPPASYAARTADDCDDGDAGVHPGATEVPCDGIDQDCVGGDALDDDGCIPADTDDTATDTEVADTEVGDTEVADTEVTGETDTQGGDTDTGGKDDGACGGCDTGTGSSGLALLPLLAALVRRRRR